MSYPHSYYISVNKYIFGSYRNNWFWSNSMLHIRRLSYWNGFPGSREKKKTVEMEMKQMEFAKRKKRKGILSGEVDEIKVELGKLTKVEFPGILFGN